MSEENEITYPMQVEIKFHITDGTQVGTVSYGHGVGRLPDHDQMADIMSKVTSALPPGFRFMNRAESTMHYLREERGYRGPNMIIPKTGKWFDPETDVDWTDLNDEPEIDEDEE